MNSTIKIENSSSTAFIDIEGVIGLSESEQFDPDRQDKVSTYEHLDTLVEQIKAIEADQVVVNIRSTGGDVNDAMLIYEALKALGVSITTRCYGYVASAATVIAQAADSGRREISANALYLIHCCQSACQGNSQTVQLTKELLEKSDRNIAQIYALASGRGAEEFLALMSANGGMGRWLTPKETVEHGLADTIIPSVPIANDALELVEQLNLPLPPKSLLPKTHDSLAERVAKSLRSILELLGFAKSDMLDEQSIDLIDSTPPDCRKETGVADVAQKSVPTPFPPDFELARPAMTQAGEDPSVMPHSSSSNRNAYQADARNIASIMR